jgi:hypothetical protein
MWRKISLEFLMLQQALHAVSTALKGLIEKALLRVILASSSTRAMPRSVAVGNVILD